MTFRSIKIILLLLYQIVDAVPTDDSQIRQQSTKIKLSEPCILLRVDKQFKDHQDESGIECELQGADAEKFGPKILNIDRTVRKWLESVDNIKSGVTTLMSSQLYITNHSIRLRSSSFTSKKAILGSIKHDKNRLRTEGVRSVLVIRVQAADKVTSTTEAVLSDSVFGNGNDPVNLSTQMKACSADKLNFIKASDRIGKTTNIKNGVITVTVSVESSQGDSAMNSAIGLELKEQFGVSSPKLLADHVMYCLPAGTMPWIAYGYMGAWLTVYDNEWCNYYSVQMHEIGHNLALSHSGEGSAEYADTTGLMGYSYDQDDGPQKCFNGAKNWQLGWYSDRRLSIDLSKEAGTFTLELVGLADYASSTNSQHVIVELTGTGRNYYLAFNRKIGMNIGTGEGADMVEITHTGSWHSTLVAKLKKGQKYTFQYNSRATSIVTIKVVKITMWKTKTPVTAVVELTNALVTKSPTISPTTSAPTTSPTAFPTTSPTTSPPTTSPTTSPPTTSPTTPPPTKFPTLSPTLSPTISSAPTKYVPPNVVVIMTGDHNIRTLGCYRSLMLKGPVWGKNTLVHTPNIDFLAKEGAIFTNFNAVTPLRQPSQASFLSGLYPNLGTALGTNDNVVTFAQVLQQRAGYFTGMIGNFDPIGLDKLGFSNQGGQYGFSDTKYQFSDDTLKFFEEINGETLAYKWEDKAEVKGSINSAYTTDFFFRKGISFIKKYARLEKHFALVLSTSDPNLPHEVRAPYDTMFKDIKFKLPPSAQAAYKKTPALPKWCPLKTNLKNAFKTIKGIEGDDEWQRGMQNYFGMVKLIDDKVGELLSVLKETGQDDNTIIVFSSDHGDMLSEHGKSGNDKPYQTSMGAPLIIRYPKKIMEGKVINTAYTSTDFAPTILSLTKTDHSDIPFEGIDASEEIYHHWKWSTRSQFRFMTNYKWAAGVERHYKLVLAKGDVPWLFDLQKDPHEMINYATHPYYRWIMVKLQDGLLAAMESYNLELSKEKLLYLDHPVCHDPLDQIPAFKNKVCGNLRKKRLKAKCDLEEVGDFCPTTCGTCCEDSPGSYRQGGQLFTCEDVKAEKSQCKFFTVKTFCPLTCGKCTP